MGKQGNRENHTDRDYQRQRYRQRRDRQRNRRREGNSGHREFCQNNVGNSGGNNFNNRDREFFGRSGRNMDRPEFNEKGRFFQKWTENQKPNSMNPFQKFTGSEGMYYKHSEEKPVDFNQGQLISSDPKRMDNKVVETVVPQSTVATQKRIRTQSELSSVSSSTTSSANSAVRSLEKAVEKSLQAAKSVTEQTTEKPIIPTDNTAKKPVDKQPQKIKAEPASKSDTSSTSSSSSSSSSSSTSSEDESPITKNTHGRDDVVCLGKLEKFENLVDEEEKSLPSQCGLCDKSDHISLHCQTICKNCNGKYHGLKDCPKPANLSIVFSNFMQFCLRQSVRYNPNEAFSVDEELKLIPTSTTSQKILSKQSAKRKRKSRDSRSHKRRTKSSTSASSDSQSGHESARGKKRRAAKFGETAIPATIPFAQSFSTPYGFNVPGAVNPLLALTQLMGLGQAQMGFQNSSVAKE